MVIPLNPSSGVPIHLQIVEQIRHSIEIGALVEGDQLPAIRTLAEELVVSPNTVVKAYDGLEQGGLIRLRHGAGCVRRERQPRKIAAPQVPGSFFCCEGDRTKAEKHGSERR